jgi:AbiTii
MSSLNTFVLQEVIDELVNTDKSLVSALMKLKYLAMLIKNETLLSYTNAELDGYKRGDKELPDYRRAPAKLLVDMQAGYNTHRNLVLPADLADPKLGKLVEEYYFLDGIGVIETQITKYKAGDVESIGSELQMGVLHYLQAGAQKLYRSDIRMTVVAARVVTNPVHLVTIGDTVRARLLTFAMETGEKFGFDIEIDSFRQNAIENNNTINYYMNEIKNSGDGVVINTGDYATVTATITITKGDFQKLNDVLRKEGIDQADIDELKKIVEIEQPDEEKKILGPKANNWILGIMSKVLNGVGKISTAITANLIAAYIKGYYGMHS